VTRRCEADHLDGGVCQAPLTPAGACPAAQDHAAVSPAKHRIWCRAHAVGCAVQNIRDASTDDALSRTWAATANPVTVGDGYLEDGSATCICHTVAASSVPSRAYGLQIGLGLDALDSAGLVA